MAWALQRAQMAPSLEVSVYEVDDWGSKGLEPEGRRIDSLQELQQHREGFIA